MEKTTKRHHVSIDERVKDIHKDSVKLLYTVKPDELSLNNI